MEIAVLGIDLGKTTCSVAGLGADGRVMLRKRIQRHRLLDFLAQLTPCVVAMEACGGAHHVGHFCVEHGHEPRLMSPLYVSLRKLFIHGARTVLHLVRDRSTPLARWVDALKGRAHVNVASVAMANKLARIAWAVLTKGERYRPSALEAA